MNAARFLILVVALLALAALPGAAAPLTGPCVPGAVYDPACDVNHDGTVNVLDIQLSAGHWNQSGPWVSDNNHTHLGQTWTGNSNPLKLTGSYGAPDYAPLVLSNNAGYGLHVQSASNDGVHVYRAGFPSTQASSTLHNGIEIEGAMGYGVYVGRADSTGLRVESAGGDGVRVTSAGSNGVSVVSAGTSGVYVGSASYGVFVNSVGNAGMYVNSAGNNGVYVDWAGNDGVHVGRAGSPSTQIASAHNNGVEVEGAQVYGLYVGRADMDGVVVNSAGGDGVGVSSAGRHGVTVGSAGSNGVFVDMAGSDGVFVNAVGSDGVYVYHANDNGVRVVSTGTDGVYVDAAGDDGVDVAGNHYAGTFVGDIYVSGSCIGCRQANFAVNAGAHALEPGDVVSIQAITTTDFDSAPALWQVVHAQPGQAVVGVVAGRAEVDIQEEHRPTETGTRLVSGDGAAQPGEYVTIVYSGPMQVRVASGESAIAAGMRLTAAADGGVRPLQTRTVDGMVVSEGAPVIGVAMGPAQDGLVWVLVNPQ